MRARSGLTLHLCCDPVNPGLVDKVRLLMRRPHDQDLTLKPNKIKPKGFSLGGVLEGLAWEGSSGVIFVAPRSVVGQGWGAGLTADPSSAASLPPDVWTSPRSVLGAGLVLWVREEPCF